MVKTSIFINYTKQTFYIINEVSMNYRKEYKFLILEINLVRGKMNIKITGKNKKWNSNIWSKFSCFQMVTT